MLFNCIFFAIMIYQMAFFMVQFIVIKRAEYLYYSLFIASTTLYIFVFNTSSVFNIHLPGYVKSILVPFEMSFAFIQTFFYLCFIVSYLNLSMANGFTSKFIRYYQWYNLFFLTLFPFLYFSQISTITLYNIVTLVASPLYWYMLYLMWKMKTNYSRVLFYGTTCSAAGAMISLLQISYSFSSTSNSHIPFQLGLLADLFILGYGLSLKAADSDKKVIHYLFYNHNLLEQERIRYARDLHDSLGGMLSSVKYSLLNFKQLAALPSTKETQLTHSIYLLDNSIAELRRIAHNILPQSLLNFGLDIALRDFCIHLNSTANPNIYYESFNADKYPNDSTHNIWIFRIAQELISNSIKHANANQIILQLTYTEKDLIMLIEDDGAGFDINARHSGSGLRDVQNQVDIIMGTLKIESVLNQGTTATITVPQKNK